MTCDLCGLVFLREQRQLAASKGRWLKYKFCSRTCADQAHTTAVTTSCAVCRNDIKRVLSQAKKSKSGKIFCSSSCSATYNNTHKSTGTRVSRLELALHGLLLERKLPVVFNSKTAIGSELDIYFPSQKLAVELNGIFHYKPIFGMEKLLQIQQNDRKKAEMCQISDIALVVLDVSKINKLTPKLTREIFQQILTVFETRAKELAGCSQPFPRETIVEVP